VAERADPYPAFRFEIRIDGFASGSFSECTGLASETEIVEYREGGRNDRVHKFVGSTDQPNLILRRGIVDRELYDWHAEIAAGRIAPRNGVILVRDASGQQVVMEWRFQDALPVKWTGPKLDALESRISLETLELAHQGLVRTL
jgi:phage tail-like protein